MLYHSFHSPGHIFHNSLHSFWSHHLSSGLSSPSVKQKWCQNIHRDFCLNSNHCNGTINILFLFVLKCSSDSWMPMSVCKTVIVHFIQKVWRKQTIKYHRWLWYKIKHNHTMALCYNTHNLSQAHLKIKMKLKIKINRSKIKRKKIVIKINVTAHTKIIYNNILI